MSLRDSQFGELKVPLTWTAAVVLVVAALVALALLLSDHRESFQTDAYGEARGLSDRVLAPVGEVLSTPGRWVGAGVETVRGYFFAVSENRRLKGELKEMRQWRYVAIALRDENKRYRTLLGLKTDPPVPMAGARIVTDSRGPFANARLANAGKENGVKPGNPVMSENGLVGRVIGVTTGASRVLLLTDPASRTPVMIDRTNARAILTGDGGRNPRLDYLRGHDAVRDGDRVLTSGDGGVIPRGLPVGVAVKGLDGRWRVVLAADRAPIDFVRILLVDDFTKLVNRKELDQMPVPPPTPGAPTIPPPAPPIGPVAPSAASPAKAAAATAGAGAALQSPAPATGGASSGHPAPTVAGSGAASKKPAAAPALEASRPAAGAPAAKAASAKATPKSAPTKPAASKPATASHAAAPEPPH